LYFVPSWQKVVGVFVRFSCAASETKFEPSYLEWKITINYQFADPYCIEASNGNQLYDQNKRNTEIFFDQFEFRKK
jgi:hypothetical protein